MSEPKAPKKTTRRTRTTRNFPASTFAEALSFANSVFDVGSGQAVKRLTLFDEIGRSPDSSASRMAITNSSKYGLTKGGYQAESIELTSLALRIFGERNSARDKQKAKIEAAISSIPPFEGVYQAMVGNKLPATSVLIDRIKEFDVGEETASEAVDTLIVNLRDVGLLKTLSGAERIVSIDTLLDELPSGTPVQPMEANPTIFDSANGPGKIHPVITADRADYETTAFYVSPIGSDDSDERKHADLFAASIVEPALVDSKLRLVRADQIDSPGVITRQVLDYIINSRLVVVDLSFHNPNVFYELAIRHLMRKPIVQLMRSRERVPFDINQSRTIMIDDRDIYSLVPQLPVYVAQISAQVRQALENPDAVDNPISIYYPNLTAQLITPDS